MNLPLSASSTAQPASHSPTAASLVFRGVSEFGEAMAKTLGQLPWALGAVLCDAQGDPVDFAYRHDRISSLDIQLCGSQLTRTIQAIGQGPKVRALGSACLTLECAHGVLLVEDLGESYILTLRMDKSCDLPKSLLAFRSLARALSPLIFGWPAVPSQKPPATPQQTRPAA